MRAATETPARLAGIDGGTLEVGGRADLVVLDDGLRAVHVLAGGVSPPLRPPSPSGSLTGPPSNRTTSTISTDES